MLVLSKTNVYNSPVIKSTVAVMEFGVFSDQDSCLPPFVFAVF